MDDIHERLRKARIDAGFKRAAHAAESLGVNPQTYTAHENGTRGYSPESAVKYARRFNVNLDWLLTGKGPMQSGSKPSAQDHNRNADGESFEWDQEAFMRAADMVEKLKVDLGVRYIPTEDYLTAVREFYRQIVSEKQHI